MAQPNYPYPPLRRMMAFIDGENLVCRYQDMMDGGRKPNDQVVHERDVFVWQPGSIWSGLHVILRATYYTYAVGSYEKVEAFGEQIGSLGFRNYDPPGVFATQFTPDRLSPQVFKKEAKSRSGKGVDIKLTVDILTHVYHDNLDTVSLLSGDGDYKPVLEEAKRMGKQVFVAAFSSGLSRDLKLIADKFQCLDDLYFVPKVLDAR